MASVAVIALPAGRPASAAVQSDAASRQSAASLDASVEVPAAAAHALSQGAKFSVVAVEASGRAVAVTLSAAAVGTSLVVTLSAEQASKLGLAVGASVVVAAVGAGWLISDAAGHVFCFVPDERARKHLHSRRLS
ncbi:hypothetical protein J5226_10915 [Lysobacter sp. K5869]|uniref:hypothetical protein n=1 Tax=Lysobacter sp. K5869 TaxID=2820808 RepID=UPI001C06408D|nr:hypothetical protein [Lysobacter sp. K5869]QWP78863.1 hypothetical protein J5226_10915 [Lysobacter sp. K5869]